MLLGSPYQVTIILNSQWGKKASTIWRFSTNLAATPQVGRARSRGIHNSSSHASVSLLGVLETQQLELGLVPVADVSSVDKYAVERDSQIAVADRRDMVPCVCDVSTNLQLSWRGRLYLPYQKRYPMAAKRLASIREWLEERDVYRCRSPWRCTGR